MSQTELEKTFNPHEIESKCYQHWESTGDFAPKGTGDAYSIMLPPPNVTGTLHMGHGFQVTLMDALIRYHRMSGKQTLWQPGADHAGIATQMVVERELAKEHKTRGEIGREKFVEHVWEWKEQSGNTINAQLRRMGATVDWSRFRFTMDDGFVNATQKVFIDLYDEGLIYRGKRLVNWDPKLHTAISDLEVVSQEEDGHLWYIRYPLVDDDSFLVVATTRPETMLGDSAIAVNPNDERFKAFIGKKVFLPLTDRQIPIIADDYVDMEFGTGCLKITPAHDFNDYEIGQRHNLPMMNILTRDAKINDNAPEKYRGMDRFDARKQMVVDLKDQNCLQNIEPHKLTVPRGDRSGVILEPYLTNQWFVKAKPLADRAIDVVRDGKIQFVPENWTKTYFQWLENIQDWCISRQLWWGHRIPAWYDDQGNIYVGLDEKDVRTKYKLSHDINLQQDEDVLDTWFSSALWPFGTLGWPEKTPELNAFYPTDVLVTGFDIIFFWVARMVMMGLKCMDDIPFRKVYITGLIRDRDGHKMSKSKGNVLDPIDLVDGISLEDLIEKRTRSLMIPSVVDKIIANTKDEFPDGIQPHGTDALRFTFCALATTGRDIRFDMGRIEGYRNFTNKIWNAARYVLMNTRDKTIRAPKSIDELAACDRWILTKLQETTAGIIKNFDEYRFDWIAQSLYEFIWNEYCDWYLELSKAILMSNELSDDQKAVTRWTLLTVLETTLRLLHPMMPFITDEIWQRVAPLVDVEGDTIMTQPYPQVNQEWILNDAADEIEWLKQVIIAIRNIRGEMNIAPSKTIPAIFHNGNEADKQRAANSESFLKSLAKVDSIDWLGDQTAPPAATGLVDTLEILIPLSGLIDKDSELNRLNKEITKLQKDLLIAQKKLSNNGFIAKAPVEVVAKEKLRAKEIDMAITTLKNKIEHIEAI